MSDTLLPNIAVEEEDNTRKLSEFFSDDSLDPKNALRVAKLLIANDEPVARNLKIKGGTESEDKKARAENKATKKEKELAKLVMQEVCIKGVPLFPFAKGAWRPTADGAVNYHSAHALSIYQTLARKHNMSKIISFRFKYILSDNDLILKLKPLYYIIKILLNNPVNRTIKVEEMIEKITPLLKKYDKDGEIQELIDLGLVNLHRISDPTMGQVFAVNSDDIRGWKGNGDEEIYFHSNNFDLCGASGEALIVDADGNMRDFAHRYEIDVDMVKMDAYRINPRSFIETKFQRHATEKYYSSLGANWALSIANEDYECKRTEQETNKILDAGMERLANRLSTLQNLPSLTSLNVQ